MAGWLSPPYLIVFLIPSLVLPRPPSSSSLLPPSPSLPHFPLLPSLPPPRPLRGALSSPLLPLPIPLILALLSLPRSSSQGSPIWVCRNAARVSRAPRVLDSSIPRLGRGARARGRRGVPEVRGEGPPARRLGAGAQAGQEAVGGECAFGPRRAPPLAWGPLGASLGRPSFAEDNAHLVVPEAEAIIAVASFGSRTSQGPEMRVARALALSDALLKVSRSSRGPSPGPVWGAPQDFP